MGVISKSEWVRDNVGRRRNIGVEQHGVTGNRVLPTAYLTYRGRVRGVRIKDGRIYSSCDIPTTDPIGKTVNNFPAARNKAWSKLVFATRSESASIGQALAEGGETLDMITNRFKSLYRAYKSLRRGRFRQFLKDLSIGPKRKHRNKIKNGVGEVSSLWLEYSFGWSPALQDVYSGMGAMSQPLPGGSTKGTGRQEYAWQDGKTNPSERSFIRGMAYVKMGADIFVDNPNLYLLQQLGIANPLSVAWEVVPFSFMVDWVFDVSSYLESFSDFLGCRVDHQYSTLFMKLDADFESSYEGVKYERQKGYILYMKRETVLFEPVPNMAFLANIGTSLTRAANAASLLGQILSK